MGYADGTDDGPPAAAGTAQATESDMTLPVVNDPPESGSDPAADQPGSAARVSSTSSKNVSFNLLEQQQPPGCMAHGADDSDDDDDDGNIGGDGDVTSSVRVAVRIRPFLPSETGTSGVIDVLPAASVDAAGAGAVGASTTTPTTGGRANKRKRRQGEAIPTSLQIGGPAGAQFTYDAVHGAKSTQADLYLDTVRPLVRQCLKGCELVAHAWFFCCV